MAVLQSRTTRVVLLSLVMLLAGLAGCLLERPTSLDGTTLIPWWVFLAFFGLTEAFVLKVRVQGQLEGVSLSEIPLVIGLFMAEPAHVILTRMVAGGLVYLFVQKHALIKATLNVCMVAASTAVSFAVFSLFVTGHQALGPAGWLAVPVGMTLTGLLEGAVLILVISWYGGEQRPLSEVLRELLFSFVVPVATSMIGLVTVYALHSGAAILPLAVTGAAALVGYRAFAGLSDRHASLERLSELSAALRVAPGSQDVISSVLRQSMDLMRAEYAEIALAGWSGSPLRWSQQLGAESVVGPVQTREQSVPFPPGDVMVLKSGDQEHTELLADRSLSEAVVVPLRVDDEVAGYILAGDRRSEERPFQRVDGRLLTTVANHASVALRNGRLMERLHFEARHDELTGLPNRFDLRDRLDDAAARAASGEAPVAVMVLDFDGFKAINDTLGHQAGDELLRVLAKRLTDRAADTAVIARLGGDEFAVLSHECADPDSAMALAHRLLSSFEEPVSIAGTRLRLGGSLGIALGPRDGESGSDLLRNADIAMYAAKSGAGGARMFSQDLVEVTATTLTLASDLRDAVSHEDISVAVQPLVCLDSGIVHSVEVLARWHHPELGEIPPEAFFSAAERSGQITALSARVLDQALVWCSTWRQAGMSVRVAVNLAPRWLADDSLPEQIQQALDRNDVPAHLLCLEITESSVIADPRRAIQTLTRLRAMGVHLSVDDFGTGYSSLTYLSRLPVDQMKIDKSFVQRLHDSPRDRAIVRSIVGLGRNLELEVVAEGVTDDVTLRSLREMGCAFGQGYLFSRPMEPEELVKHLKEHGLVEQNDDDRTRRPDLTLADRLPAQLRSEVPGRAPAPPGPPAPRDAGAGDRVPSRPRMLPS